MCSQDTDFANRFLFVVWSMARPFEERILGEISCRFKVVRTFEVSWPRRHFTANLAAFYGWKGRFCWWNKARKCGRGPFLVIEVEDPAPRWERGSDTSGHDLVLNRNVQDVKCALRSMTGHSNRIHASVTAEETAHEIAALDSVGPDGLIPYMAMQYAGLRNDVPCRHGLSDRLRCEWNRIVAAEGARLGISDCRPFLENKIANDIFYEGMFNGRPCIVKCSSRAPDSIANEYEMLKRMHAEAPEVFPEPFALWTSRNGRMAFVAMEKVAGGVPSSPAVDILRDRVRRDTELQGIRGRSRPRLPRHQPLHEGAHARNPEGALDGAPRHGRRRPRGGRRPREEGRRAPQGGASLRRVQHPPEQRRGGGSDRHAPAFPHNPALRRRVARLREPQGRHGRAQGSRRPPPPLVAKFDTPR